MSNAYYAQQQQQQQPQRQPAYDNPLHNPSRAQPLPHSSSHTSMLAPDHDGVDYHHYHGQPASYTPQPYHDPYLTLHRADDPTRPVVSSENLVRHTSSYNKDAYNSHSDDGHELTLRGTEYALAKDEETGRLGYGRGHRIQATDGLLPDVAPDMERLNAEQREIMKQFPPDLDDENGGKSGVQAAKDLLKNWKSWFQLKYLHWWIMLVVVIALVAFTTIYHKQIVDWLTPISQKVTTVGWGWIIPVAILFIISFPPLFGHEIVLILVGLVYGLWIGFGIASLGTLLGEIGNFYAFKHCLRSMAANYERKNIHYACMAEMVRDGGFWVMFLARLSAIPGHFTTAVFATVGMNIFIFTFAAVLALPKQLLIVYLGVAIKNSGNGTEDTKSKIIKYVVLAISFVITVWTAYWLYQKMEKVRPGVSAKLRQKRYELLLQARTPGTEGYSGSREHVYPPVGGYGGGVDASYGYRAQGAGEGGYQEGDFSTDTYAEPMGVSASASRQPILSHAAAPQAEERYNPPSAAAAPQKHQPAPEPAAPQAGRQPIAAPLQFHRPLRHTSAVPAPTSPFQDPAPAPTAPSNGFPAARTGARAGAGGVRDHESTPLTRAQGDWASTSSLAPSPVDGPPPDYASYAPSSVGEHAGAGRAATARVDPTVQRYHLSD
ncbi:conserved hypothetical protein [Sporisorium reilianum SRZ2]|uniref:Golgi apparatus membrane protein TVP38 n=1 Tax=Sporisorium reilianum (strain SRZ2) TaxID=999809 RepID=E6ZK21_SPORE|nr:conserved hypothetical protein [Sporisorium reilianum SRZ2]